MRARDVLGLTLILVLFAIPPALATAQQRAQIRGVVLSLNMGNNSFLISEKVQNDERYWLVKRSTRTKIFVSGRKVAFGQLRRGDSVYVEGRLTGTREILAAEVRVTGRGASSKPPVVLRKPDPTIPIQIPSLGDVLRITAAPEIIRPANGARVDGEFTIVGRTAPHAEVRIEVVPRYLVFDLPGASATVRADDKGVFAHNVQPVVRLSGSTYRITVKAKLLGLESPAATLTVVQR